MFTFLIGTLAITLLGCTQPKKTETTFSLLIILTWPTLIHREPCQRVKLEKNEVYQQPQGTTMTNLPVPQARKKGGSRKRDRGRLAGQQSR